MTVRVAITHRTEYLYDRPVALSPHVFRLRPAFHCRTPISDYSLTITPEKRFVNWQQDPFGNYQARVVFADKTRELTVVVDLVAEMTDINPFDFFVEDAAEFMPFTYNERLHEELLPYLELDEDLMAGEVRLSMGGEPTFVSIDDMEGVEWNTAADGPKKRVLADDLAKRLFKVFASGGIRHRSQGKWYPGESLPRWQITCIWRSDGRALWRDPALLADVTARGDTGIDAAERFIRLLAQYLAIHPRYARAGYEDVFYHLWEERKLPVNLNPLETDLKDPLERQRVERLLDREPGQPTGYALPLRPHSSGRGWQSSLWEFRREQMFLLPGDAPMGLRLPLDSLPRMAPEEREIEEESSPMLARPPLGEFHARFESGPEPVREQQRSAAPYENRFRDVIHTALCVETRQGHLHVFMPSLGRLEDYLDLLAAVEKTASKLTTKVVLEGYEPPDYRLKRLQVTPDPGVIEVNIHPASS